MLGAWREARQVLKLLLVAAMTLVIAAPAAATEPDNTLIRTNFDGAIYRVVGQAPLHLGVCPFNPKDTLSVDRGQRSGGLPPVPRPTVR